MATQVRFFARSALCLTAVLGLSMLPSVVLGQGKSSGKTEKKTETKEEKKEAEHDHPHAGPHDGSLIELGEEEYHGELVVDEEKDTVTVYLLDGEAKGAVANDAKEAVINVKHEGKAKQYKLKALPLKGEIVGKSSRYVLESHDLIHDLENKDSKPMLRLAIKGKTYNGKIEPLDHEHEHEHKDKEEKEEPKAKTEPKAKK